MPHGRSAWPSLRLPQWCEDLVTPGGLLQRDRVEWDVIAPFAKSRHESRRRVRLQVTQQHRAENTVEIGQSLTAQVDGVAAVLRLSQRVAPVRFPCCSMVGIGRCGLTMPRKAHSRNRPASVRMRARAAPRRPRLPSPRGCSFRRVACRELGTGCACASCGGTVSGSCSESGRSGRAWTGSLMTSPVLR